MDKVILSSGIAGIDWSVSIDLLAAADGNISHFENMMLNTKGKYDDLVVEKTENNATYKKLKPLFKRYITRLLKDNNKPVNFLSDPLFLESGAAWHTLNADKSFGFFFCSPEYYLAKVLGAASDAKNIDHQECLDAWLESARKIWEFYVRYPESTLLINIEDVERNPAQSVTNVLDFLGGSLDEVESKKSENSDAREMENSIEKLSFLLLQNLKLKTIEASRLPNEMYENLALTSILADNELTYQASERASVRLSECQGLIALIASRQQQLEAESATYSASKAELIAENAQIRALLSHSEADKTKLVAFCKQTETRLSELSSENELAILQISQLQEELVSTHLSSKQREDEFTAQSSALETRISEFATENQLAILQIKQLQEELESIHISSKQQKNEFAKHSLKLETRGSELAAENELAILQINQLQEELESIYVSSKQQEDEFAIQSSELETRISELVVENELAILQINQLQEELEYYYDQYQKMTYSPPKNISYSVDLNRLKHSLSLMNMS